MVLDVNELDWKWRGTTVTSSWITVTLSVWRVSEKHVSQHGRPSPTEFWAQDFPNTKLGQYPTSLRCSVIYLYCFTRIHGDCEELSVSEYTVANGPLATVSGASGPHTPLSVLASRRSEVVSASPRKWLGGKMTRNRLGYSTTSHLAICIWVKYGVISRIVVFSKVKAAETLKWPCGLIWGHHGWKNLTFTYKCISIFTSNDERIDYFKLSLSFIKRCVPWTITSPTSVAARSKAWVCGRSLAGIVGSNPAWDMVVCLLWVLYVVRQRSLRRADHLSREVLPSLVCLSVIMKPRQWGGHGQLGAVSHGKKILRHGAVIRPINYAYSYDKIFVCLHYTEHEQAWSFTWNSSLVW